jgi:perosamine synthetase
MNKIPISKPYFGEEELLAVQEPLKTGWVVQGPNVAEFERLFAEYTRAEFALATTSCTTALHLALMALGVGPGDEVILPAFTWVATANVIEMLGAKPVFIDIEIDTFHIDINQTEKAITPRTKVILPVSLFGLSADMQPIVELARAHNLKVVEDDACGTGAWYHGQHAGTLADIGCFSFHPRKSISTGEGGMVITADEQIASIMRSIRDHGASVSDHVRHHGPRSYMLPDFNIVGSNFRMTDIQAAVGVVQMGRLEYIMGERIRVADRYDEALAGIEWLRAPIVPSGYQHGYQSYPCMFQPEQPSLENVERLHAQRNQLMDSLEAAGIATRPATHAVHMLGYFSQKYGIKPEDYPCAYLADQLSISLPLFVQLTEEEQEYVITHLKNADIS